MPILEREIGAKLSEIRLDYPPLNKEVIQDVRNLWEDPSIQETYLWKCAASSWLCRVLHGESGPISWSRLRTNKGAHRRGRAWPNWRLFHGEGKLGQRHATTRVATVRGHHHLIKCPLTMARCCSFPLHCHWRNYSCRFKPLWSSPVIWQWYQHINSFSSSSVHSIQLSVQELNLTHSSTNLFHLSKRWWHLCLLFPDKKSSRYASQGTDSRYTQRHLWSEEKFLYGLHETEEVCNYYIS